MNFDVLTNAYVVRKSELRHLPNGTAVFDVTVPKSFGWGDDAETLWIKATFWGKLAETMYPYIVEKQTRLNLQLQPSKIDRWEGRDGVENTTYVYNVQQVDIASGKADVDSRQEEDPFDEFDDIDEDEEVPF